METADIVALTGSEWPKPGTPPAVLSAGHVEEFTPAGSGNTYSLAAPSYGDAGRIVATLAARYRPTAAVVHQAIRDALEKAGKLDMVALVDAYEAADDDLQSVYAAYGRDNAEEVRRATRALLAADRGLKRAEAAVWDDADLAALRMARLAAEQEETALLLREALRGWAGETLPAYAVAEDKRVQPALVQALPARDAAALVERIRELTRPSPAAEKN